MTNTMDNPTQNSSTRKKAVLPRKNKVLLRLVGLSEDAANPEGQNLAFIANCLTSFLLDLGFSRDSLQCYHGHISHCIDEQDREGLATIILNIVENIDASGLPEKEKSAIIHIENKNNQEMSLSIESLRDVLKEHLTTEQIQELKELLAKKKSGNLKRWFNDLSINTSSNLLTSLLLKLPILSNL